MDPCTIIVAGLEGGRLPPTSMRARILDAWRSAVPLEVSIAQACDLDDENLPGRGAVVLLVDDGHEISDVLAMVAMIQEAGVASIVLLEREPEGPSPYEFAGAHVETHDCDPVRLAAKLEAILGCQQEITRLRRDVSLAQRFHGGLEGEITRIHEELQLAAMVQREFLPRTMPSIHGVEFAVLWRPAHYVSGDIYDVARLDQDHIGFFVADAVGHGVPAALMTMVICRSLTTKTITGSSYRIIEPSEVLARLNQDMIRRQGRTTRFATAIYAIVNCRSRVMRLAGAGHPPPAGALLEQASFQIDAGERVCLIGRNGAGKSTLLKIVGGEVAPDAGEVWRQPGLAIARLSQDLPCDDDATVFDVVAAGLADVGRLLAEFHRVSHAVADDESLLRRMEALQHQIEACDGWSLGQRVDHMLARLELPADARIGALSGGWRRRVALAQALVSDPDLLLLDEPTNHLDIELIQWLEEQLLELRGGVLFVTHDRALLTRLATRIVELDRGVLTSWAGDYSTYLAKKSAALEEEARHAALFDKKLAQEEAWIRQGIKARRTRNEGRVRALVALREARAQRRELEGKVRLSLDDGRASGKLVAEAQHVTYAWSASDPPIVRDFSQRIMRGDRIGLVGANGAGKTTLLRLLLGQLAPSSGSVRLGTKLEVAYYDQLRAALELDKTVIENLAGGREYIEVQGQRRHVMGYLQDFLFSPDRARTPMKALSGGEHNRVLLARLFAQPANLLVLDEPTNDLDMETLELLEELLVDFRGTILLVSHDRAFLDNVVTSTLVFEGDGRIQEYVGGYSDWLRQRARPVAAAAVKPVKDTRSGAAAKPKPAKLGFKDARELEQVPAKIESLETEQSELVERLGQPAFYKSDAAEQTRVHARIAALTQELEATYARWAELEALRDGR